MKQSAYRHLCAMNEGFGQARRSLKALSHHANLHSGEIRRFERLAAEVCAATNSYLLEALGAAETNRAGRLFVKRKARERRDEEL